MFWYRTKKNKSEGTVLLLIRTELSKPIKSEKEYFPSNNY